jgi:predicted dehydrogenase
MERTLRAGIIGLGFIGAGDQIAGDRIGQKVADLDGHHREALSRHPRIELVAGSSRDPGRRERFQQASGARTYANWRDMLAAEKLDIVSVASMTPDHPAQTIGCAQAGVRAVYCEKPIAPTLPDAERMIAACRQAGTLLVINHNRRFQPNYRRLAEFISSGELGDLVTAHLHWGSGRLGNVGTHFIDALRLLTRREVEAVSATLDLSARPDCRGSEFRDPGGWAVLRMTGGLMAMINAPDYAKDPAEIVVSGSRGRAVVRGNDVHLEFWDGRRTHWPSRRDGMTSMDVAVAEIVSALENGATPSSPGEEALCDLEVILGCHASHERNGAWTNLPLSGADRERILQSG